MKEITNVFNAIVKNNESEIQSSISVALKAKFDQAKDVKRVAVASEIYNAAVCEENTNQIQERLEKPKSKKDLVDLLKKAKGLRGISDDEYMQWYGNMDDKLFSDWDKMIKKDSNYKNAYQLGVDGGSDKNPHKKGTLASAIWADQYAAGAMDA